MATAQQAQNFVAQTFEAGDVKAQSTSSSVVSAPQEFSQQVATAAISHGIVVASQTGCPSPQHAALQPNTVTLTVQPSSIQTQQATLQPQIITANVISGEEYPAKEGRSCLFSK